MHTQSESSVRRGGRLPRWLKVPAPGNDGYRHIKQIVGARTLHTVCESARCPNIGECWGCGTATFMILGAACTRDCRFCAVPSGAPAPLDEQEPARVADAVAQLGLRHAVITSVTRDDVPDGGAGAFAETIAAIRERSPGTTVEVLIPDLQGDERSLDVVFDARPDILNHNLETVRRLYSEVRPQADYDRSLGVIRRASEAGLAAKSGIMVGVGETKEEVVGLMHDLVDAGGSILTIGQYLQPTPRHHPIDRFWHPDEFAELKTLGEAAGLKHVESGPLVRSSYHAAEQVETLRPTGRNPR